MAIIRKEAYFNSSTGKNKIHCMIWQDDAVKPIALFQIAHGMSEHIERYDDFACFLAGHGFIVCGNVHLGHGKSVNSLDDLGYMDDKNGHIRMVDDMHILHHIMHKRYPDLPYFLFGHSMGSFLSRSYAAHFGKELAGAIFCGTGELPASLEGVVSAFDKVVDKIGPHANADLLFKIGNGVFNAQFKNPRTNVDWISTSEENLDRYLDDPLCGFNFKLGGTRDVVRILMEVSRKDWAQKVPQDLPIMLISGAKDSVGFNGRGVLAVSDNLELAGNEPTVILYPNDRHEILNENDHEKIYNDIMKWLDGVLAAREEQKA